MPQIPAHEKCQDFASWDLRVPNVALGEVRPNDLILDDMSKLTYLRWVDTNDKPIVWFIESWQTPPMGTEARTNAGTLLRRVQKGIKLTMPDSRPMPVIGSRCHELRITDAETDRI